MSDKASAASNGHLPRLLVGSVAESEQIREIGTKYAAFEQSVGQFQKSKRWLVARRRADCVLKTTSLRNNDCALAWLEWQCLRAMRACAEVADPEFGAAHGSHTLAARLWHDVAIALAVSQDECNRWGGILYEALVQKPHEAEAALSRAAEPLAAKSLRRLRALAPAGPTQARRGGVNKIILGLLVRSGKLDVGTLVGLGIHPISDSLLMELGKPESYTRLISDTGLAARQVAFQKKADDMARVRALAESEFARRQSIFGQALPKPEMPPLDWHDAWFFVWLYQIEVAEILDRLSAISGPGNRWLDRIPGLLGAPVCWQLWLLDCWEEVPDLGPAAEEPQRTVLRELVEHPARFLRFANPIPVMADLRRALRPVADLLEGSPLAVERAALVMALDDPIATHEGLLHLLATYCADRWRAGVSPKIHARLVERFTEFLRDDIAPQAPEILRACAVEVGPVLRTRFDAEFEAMLVAEEAAQDRVDAEMREQANAWRLRIPAASDVECREAIAGMVTAPVVDDGPVVLRYLLNLGEPRPREERLTTTPSRMADDLEAFCLREGIAVNIPFSSIAHAIEHYLFCTPAEKKSVWRQRETYGPLELHKIKRGAMRLLVRESDEGLWLHLLQRKEWFFGA
jgi:hypothetical protein